MRTTRLALGHETRVQADDHQSLPKPPLMKQKQRSLSLCSCSANLLVSSLTAVITLLILFQLQSVNLSSSASLSWLVPRNSATCQNGGSSCLSELENTRSRLRDAAFFRPTKNGGLEARPFDNNTFFLSSVDDNRILEDIRYIYLPANATDNRLLCVTGDNQYTLSWPDALPRNATIVTGLTFICDTYFQYVNIWHALCAMVPFGWWLGRNCNVAPDRWVLYHHAVLTKNLGHWASKIMAAMTGREVVLMDDFAGGPKCFEKALVFRNNEGKIQKMERREGYDLIRCKAREYCGVTPEDVAGEDPEAVRLTLLLRSGNRSFKDDRAVINIFQKQCNKVKGCVFTVRWGNNMTFCEQVKVMSETDVMATQHGAQMTNFFFMEKNSSVMEMYGKGWKEYGGTGQYVYHWMANWVGMRHHGEWRDTEGPDCPHDDRVRCFWWMKNRKVGHNETEIGDWTAKVIKEVKEYKVAKAAEGSKHRQTSCPCKLTIELA